MFPSPFLKIATAGKAIDGREIKPEWLESMAANYAPDTYTAVINSEHWFHPGLGHVVALKAEADDQKRMALWASIIPTAELLTRYQAKRQLFFSMEIREDFPGEGEIYLRGLAITDIPASQGLTPLQFSAQAEAHPWRFNYTGEFIPVALRAESEAPAPTGEETAPGWFKDFMARFKGQAPQEKETEEEAMTPKELERFEAMEKDLGELKILVETKFKAAPPTKPEAAMDAGAVAVISQDGEGEETPTEGKDFAAEVGAVLGEKLKPITDRLDHLEGQPVETGNHSVTDATGEGGDFKGI